MRILKTINFKMALTAFGSTKGIIFDLNGGHTSWLSLIMIGRKLLAGRCMIGRWDGVALLPLIPVGMSLSYRYI
jgi:hypothetical protein